METSSKEKNFEKGLNDFLSYSLKKKLDSICLDWIIGSHQNTVNSVCFSKNDDLSISVSNDKVIKICDLKHKGEKDIISGHQDLVYAYLFQLIII